MRHLNLMTKGRPQAADAIEDGFCSVAGLVAALIRAVGGASPIATYIETKCNFGIPVDETGGDN